MITHEQIQILQNIKSLRANIETACDTIDQKALVPLSIDELYDAVFEIELCCGAVLDYADFEKAVETAAKICAASKRAGIRAVSRYDESFPVNLRYTVSESGAPAVPLLLYYKGDLSVSEMPSLAVIGTRTPTPDTRRRGASAGQRSGHQRGMRQTRGGYLV